MVLSSGDPMEEVNKFMRDVILTKEGDLFDNMKNDGCFEDDGVE